MKKYSKSNLLKAVSLGTAMATLLSSVSPVFAAGVGITGGAFFNTSGPEVLYPRGSHGSIVFAGDNDFCGVDNVVGRGGKQQETITDDRRIPVKEQYERFIYGYNATTVGNPYGESTSKVTWMSEGKLTNNNSYMGKMSTDGSENIMPEAYGVYSFATGCGSAAMGNYSTAFGAGATTKAGGAQAFGVSALASGKASVAMGVGSEASEEATVAIGGLATASGKSTVAVGAEAKAEKEYAIAIGARAEAKESGAIAIGGVKSERTEGVSPQRKAIAESQNAIAIGSHTYAKTEDSVAIGANAQAFAEDSVAIGGGSISDRKKGVNTYDPTTGQKTDKRTGLAWKSTAGAFSIGEVGGRDGKGNLTRQITGVAAGSEDTDAVNVAQLKAMRDVIAGGGSWQISANNKDSTAVNAGNTVDFSVTNSGEGKDNLKITKNNVDSKHNIQFTLADELNLTEVTTGHSFMNDDGFYTKNGNDDGPSMTGHGINAHNTQIENVADATAEHQAVNLGQLKDYVKKNGGGGWKLSVNNQEATDVKPGNTVKFVAVEKGEGNTKSQNINITKDDGHTVKFDLADNIKLTSVTTGDSNMSGDGFFINGEDGPRMTIDGINAGNQAITNVAEATDDNEAVNLKQLKEFSAKAGGWKLSIENGKATDIDAGSTVNFFAIGDNNAGKKNIKIANTNGKNISFDLADNINVMSVKAGQSIMDATGFRFENGEGHNDGPSITVNGIHAGGKTIKGVAEATENDEAVNFGQLKTIKQLVENGWKLSVNGGDATDVKAGSKVDLVSADQDGGKNIKIEKNNGNTVTFALNESIKVKSITTDNSIMNGDGFGFVDGGGPKITFGGIQAGDKKITGVAEGTNNTDAVNYGQLKEVRTLAENGWKLSVDGENATNVKAGSTVDLIAYKSNEGHKNITIEKNNDNSNKVTFSLNDKLKLTSVTTGNSIMNNSGFGFVDGGPKIMESGIQAGGKKITGVAKGTDNTDAVNYGQLTEIKDQIASNSLVKWVENQKLITIGKEKEGTKIDIANKSGDARTISGVEKGGLYEDSIEAVNGSQLWDTNQNVAHIDTKVTAISDAIINIGEEIHGLSQDALRWSENEQAFVARHGEDGNKTNSKITFLKNGDISEKSTDAVNGSQIHSMGSEIANFFGGNTSFKNGVFTGPRYNLTIIDSNGGVNKKEYNDVGSALSGLDMNIRNVNHHFINAMNDIASYFGGGAGYDENKEWHAPTFQVYHIDANDTVSKKPYDNVAGAFEGVNNTFKNIHNQISDITKNSLVKQEEDGLITVGKETGGDKISVANRDSKERTISGVKEAMLSITSTDAVNGSQLFKIAQKTSKYFGGSTDVINGIEPAFVIDGNPYNNVTEAFTGVNISIHKIDNKISDLEKNNLVKQEGGVSGIITIGKDTAGTEINIAGFGKVARKISGVREAEKGDEAVNKDQLDKSIEKISKDIETASAAAVLYDKNADGIVNYSSVTLGGDKNNGPVALRNVKDGDISANSTDAINGSQLYSISNQLAAYFGGGAKYENGKWTAPQFTIVQVNADGTTVEKTHNNVADAFGDVNKNMSNINNRIDDVINKVDSDALKWNKDKKAYDATHDGTPSKIINVANGKIEKGSKDAVNGGQLWQTNERVAKVENRVTDVEKHVEIIDKRVDNISNTIGDIGDIVTNIDVKVDNIDNKVNDIAEDAVRYDRDENGNKTNKITLKGGDPSEPVMIDNVADGKIEKGSKEAVNGGQLHDYTKEQMEIVLDESKRYTDQRINNITIDAIDEAVDKSKQYTDMKFDALNYSIESAKKEARQGAAIGLAVSNLRYNDTPGKLSVGFGTGLWRSQSAFAFGAGYTSENGNIRSNVSVTTSGGHWGVGAGFNMTLN
ncbi:Vomp family autotransporter [Bartonella sp. B1099]|uniref:Vomp family autotransporter n=1 Tax=Bartonella sp. B1099 TaxID=2911422 RepID=UPI0020C45A8E|nr:Vomp family autotransporter [Bartonella sp. B1099]